MRGGSLMLFGRNKYSQNGEDGVIAETMRRLGIGVGAFVEFGAGDGRSLSNTLRLAEHGWSGVWIEADPSSCDKATQLAATFEGRVEVFNNIVDVRGPQRLDSLLAKTKTPRTLDFMSIDIDSHDLEVWLSIVDYRPKVVLIEINSGVPLGVDQVHGNGKEGASFTSMMKVAAAKSYQLVCHTGNLLFVDRALAPLMRLPAQEIADPTTLFNPMWAQWAADARLAKETP